MTTINDSPITNDSDTELEAFEQRVNEMLSTGELDSALSITDENGVAQVLPMLDTEPIAHLLDGIEELGGSAQRVCAHRRRHCHSHRERVQPGRRRA